MLRKIGQLSLILFVFAHCSSDSNTQPFNSDTLAKMRTKKEEKQTLHLVRDVPIYDDQGNIQVVIEIPAGSVEKWEVNKETGSILRDSIDGKPRTINYSGYPANYGFVPQTVLSKEFGGDGDPLDAIVLGDTLVRGDVVSCRMVGVLKLEDQGEQDDKLIFVLNDSPYGKYHSIESLEAEFPGTREKLQSWFTKYKGPGKMVSKGIESKTEALTVFKSAEYQYKKGLRK